jgi:hypothetical protein
VPKGHNGRRIGRHATTPQADRGSIAAGQQHRNGTIASQTGGEPEASEWDTIQTIPQLSAMFHITPSMLCMDEIMGKTPLKDLAQL